MSTDPKQASNSTTLPTELKAEQALGLIGLGLMQKMSNEVPSEWNWSAAQNSGKADLHTLRQRLELTALAIQTGSPLSTAEVTQLLGAKPGSEKTQRGGIIARRISRNVWKLDRADKESTYWRN